MQGRMQNPNPGPIPIETAGRNPWPTSIDLRASTTLVKADAEGLETIRRRHYGATLARVKQFFLPCQVFSRSAEFPGQQAAIAGTVRRDAPLLEPTAVEERAAVQVCASLARHQAIFSAVVVGRAPEAGFFAAADGLAGGAA